MPSAIDDLLEVCRESLRFEADLTVSEWADRHRMLSGKASAEPGPWRTDRTPYLKEVMDCLSTTSPVQRVVLMAGAQLGKTYVTPASHGEGRFVASEDWIRRLFENGQVATQYADPEGNISMDEEWNVNGSYAAIEGITSPDGRILGKMAHVERRGDSVAVNIYGEQDLKIFESGVAYFK